MTRSNAASVLSLTWCSTPFGVALGGLVVHPDGLQEPDDDIVAAPGPLAMISFRRALASAIALVALAARGSAQSPGGQGGSMMMGPGMMACPMCGSGADMGPGMMGRGPMMGPRGGGHLMQRHMLYMHGGLPPPYANLSNPLSATPSVLSRGADLYDANCASCHGPNGHGDGEAGRGLVPPAANVAATARMPMMGDDFLYWAIAEGGEPFGTAMPAFHDALAPDEIWAVVMYLRAGLPTAYQIR